MRASVAKAPKSVVQLLPRSLREPKPTLSRTDRDRLGERLRAMYEALCDEPLPQKLQDPLDRLA